MLKKIGIPVLALGAMMMLITPPRRSEPCDSACSLAARSTAIRLMSRRLRHRFTTTRTRLILCTRTWGQPTLIRTATAIHTAIVRTGAAAMNTAGTAATSGATAAAAGAVN